MYDNNNKYRLLFVDDDPNMIQMVRLFLSNEAAEIDFAANGRIAIKKITTGKFDIIVSDLQMPEVDGLELIKYLSDLNLSIPIIIISAYGLESMAAKAMDAGALAVIHKPFDSKTLIKIIKTALTESR